MAVQLDLFAAESTEAETPTTIPGQMGRAKVTVLEKSQILTPASGFMGDYDFTISPYTGCQFGCAYCYAAFFVSTKELRENWGYWVNVKSNAVADLTKRRALRDKKIYMSPVTDPYQPIEAKIGLTRRILDLLAEPERQPRLVIQTRSPLITRDIDILREFKHLRVNMTVTTDSDTIRKKFEPSCPSNDRRLEAIAEVKEAGIKTSVTVTPMLPLENPERFALRLAAMNADVYVAQPFKPSNGPFAASTRKMALELADEYGWTQSRYQDAFAVLKEHLPHLYEGREGFMPE